MYLKGLVCYFKKFTEKYCNNDFIMKQCVVFQVEKLDPITGQWMPCCQTKTPEADVTGLQEGKKYKFRVKAVNKEGESEPLEADQYIVAKNPFGKH